MATPTSPTSCGSSAPSARALRRTCSRPSGTPPPRSRTRQAPRRCPIRSSAPARGGACWTHPAGHPLAGKEEDRVTVRLVVCSLLVNDQNEALRFFVDRLGVVVADVNLRSA